MVYNHIYAQHGVAQVLADKAVQLEYELLIGRTECLILRDCCKERCGVLTLDLVSVL